MVKERQTAEGRRDEFTFSLVALVPLVPHVPLHPCTPAPSSFLYAKKAKISLLSWLQVDIPAENVGMETLSGC